MIKKASQHVFHPKTHGQFGAITLSGKKTMIARLHIVSYFSLPIDLASEMKDWPEFVAGNGYDVELRSVEEEVSVRYQEDTDNPFVAVYSSHPGMLFDRVVGRVIYALSAHSDNLMVDRRG